MMRKSSLKHAWARLLEASSYVIACHVKPDGDTLGSALGLAHVLRQYGKDVVVISSEVVPDNYEFLPESKTVVTDTSRRDFDMGIVIDSDGPGRVGSSADVINSAKTKAVIDHHVANSTDFGDIRIVDPRMGAAAELVVRMLEAGNAKIDKIAATQLLTGLISDTGAFRFANTTASNLQMASRLAILGADPVKIVREVYESRPLRAAKLLGRALSSLQIDDKGFVVWAAISQKDLEELGCSDADTDSIVNSVSAVKGPSVALFFREATPNSVRVSLRSRGGVDVNVVARVFGGGGHAAAAGCTVEAPLNESIERVVSEVIKWTES